MGYRSDVAMAMPKKEYDNMLNILEGISAGKLVYPDTTAETAKEVLALLGQVELCGSAKVYTSKNQKEGVTYLVWRNIKWYESDSDINWLMNYLKSLENYEYMRIGEDYDDTEMESNGYDYDRVLGLHRDITINEY